MSIDGKENHRIPLDVARRMTKRFRDRNRQGPRRIQGHAVSRGIIEEILAQPGCMGLRMYHAEDDEGRETLVIVGITADEQDMASGVIAEQTRPCPPFCGGDDDPLATD
jgi:hypothetical protein